jgi:hypothetical protein
VNLNRTFSIENRLTCVNRHPQGAAVAFELEENASAHTPSARRAPREAGDILCFPRGSGGIGRRASLRSWWPKGRRGSSPFFRINIFREEAPRSVIPSERSEPRDKISADSLAAGSVNELSSARLEFFEFGFLLLFVSNGLGVLWK